MSLAVNGFRCKHCMTQPNKQNLTEDIVVDRKTYGCVKSFCYLGDTLDGDGGADIAATARIRSGWIEFREILP